MRKKLVFALLGVYLLLVVILSLPLPFLEGDYFGFPTTFGLLCIISLPFLIGALAVWQGVTALVRHGRVLDVACGAIGAVVLALYPLSFFGFLKASSSLGWLNTLFPVGILLILVYWSWCAVQFWFSRSEK